MAINFSQVKAISIPEGDVKQVSLNGTVLWKKQKITLYRQLEYIFTDGANSSNGNRIDTGLKPELSKFYFTQFKMASNPTNTNNHIMSCSGDNISGRGKMRWISYFNKSNSHFYYRVGRDGVSDTQCSLAFNIDHKYEARHRTYDVSYMHWESFKDLDTGQDVGNFWDTNTNVYTYTPANMPNICLMGYVYDNNSVYASNHAKGYLYRFYRRNGDDNAPIDVDMYPAQRKSDNQVGMYDVVNHTFIAMTGVQTSASVGPTVAENPEGWD